MMEREEEVVESFQYIYTNTNQSRIDTGKLELDLKALFTSYSMNRYLWIAVDMT